MAKEKYIKPICPRCGSKNTRAIGEGSTIICQHDGYSGHWRQFFEGTEERKEIRKLFAEGKLEGLPVIQPKRKKNK